MANSFVTYTANGSTQQFDITFDYIDRTHIKVYVDNVEDTTFTFINDSRIQTTSIPANAAVVKVERNTPVDARLVDFQDGSVLTEADLDRSANQNFFIAQETEDEVATKLGQNNAGVFDALNKRIINVGTPTAGTDATNKTYIDTQTNNAFTSATNAATSETNAAASETAAATSETNAATSASNASTSESNASTSATNAATSATAAAASATAAAASETAAASSETAAATSETNAGTSETNAASSASTASTQATNASNSASAASTSETNASNSATAAATSATNAATSASNASTSESNASTSASNASTSETNAASSATSAATSATTATTQASAASTSATNAATSETNAATSETNAATSATNAATSETNASNSASAASTSATNAGNSATAAATSAASAAAAYDTFDDRYLGSKTSDPTVDNDGNALVQGALYFNSSANEMRVYDGANWIAASSAGTASLIIYEYTATSGQTTFTGSDDNAASLSYSVNNLFVTLNGVVLDPDDYTATSGTSIVLGTGATTGDLLTVHAFKSFTVSELNANNLTDGTIPDARFPSVLPAVDGSNLTGITSVGGATGVDFNDSVKARFGTGNDLEIFHDGSNSYIKDVGTGNLSIQSDGAEIQLSKTPFEHMIRAKSDGSVDLYYDNSKKLETTTNGVTVNGALTATSTITSSSGTSSFETVDVSGEFNMTGTGTNIMDFNAAAVVARWLGSSPAFEEIFRATRDAGISLKYNGSEKIATTSTGATVTGDLSVTGNLLTRKFFGYGVSSGSNASGWRTINFGTEVDDDDSRFTHTSGTYTVGESGTFLLVGGHHHASGAHSAYQIRFHSNVHGFLAGTGAGNSDMISISMFHDATLNEVLSVQVYHNNTAHADAGGRHSFFGGYLVK